jgi:hypothetical protein
MRRFFSFWWLCLRTAFRGNSAFANDWQWLFGIPACSALYVLAAGKRDAPDLTTGYPIADAFLAALGAFAVTWLIAFAVRLANSPASLYYEEKRRADLAARRIEILFPRPVQFTRRRIAFQKVLESTLYRRRRGSKDFIPQLLSRGTKSIQ